MRHVWLCCTATLLVASCRCGGPPGALGDVLTSYCQFIDRCPGQLQYPITYRSQAECVDLLKFATTCHIKTVRDAAGEPYLTFEEQLVSLDPEQAKACQTFLEEAPCDTRLEGCDPKQPDTCNPCSRAFALAQSPSADAGEDAPGAAVDERCEQDTDCATGLYCLSSSRTADGGETCGVCKPLRSAGGDCIDPPHVGCAPGLFCQRNITSGTCVVLFGAGTACSDRRECASDFCNPRTMVCDTGGQPGDACTQDPDCRAGFCDPASSKCTPVRSNGDPCTANTQCSTGLCDPASQKCGRPDGATCAYAFECQNICDPVDHQCKPGTPLGGSCTRDEACNSNLCHPRLRTCARSCSSGCGDEQFCDEFQACQSPRPDGSACERADQCSSGFCNGADVCAKKPGLGDACGALTDCLPLGRCRNGVCVAPAKPGEACDGYDACAAPFFCLENKCQLADLSCKPAKVGASCAPFSVCEPGAYCDALQNFTCVAKKSQGESCVLGVECIDGLFCDRSVLKCQAPVPAGGSCARRQPCAPGLFCDPTSSPEQCTAPKPLGERCDANAHCQSQNCKSMNGDSVCVAECIPVPPGEQPVCHPTRCADLGYTCGSIDGGCGEVVSCGGCAGLYQTCGGGGQVGVCGCTPTRTCTERECDRSPEDGCGNRLTCRATCAAGTTCGGGSTSGICGCRSDSLAGPRFGSMAVSMLPGGSSTNYEPWDSVTEVFATDDAGAHVHFGSTNSASQMLHISGFGFNLPPAATVNGITVEWVGRSTDFVSIDSVMVFAAGRLVLTSGGGGHLGTTWSTGRAGGANDLWNWPFSVDEVNSPDFGVQLRLRSLSRADAWLDSVWVTVSYAAQCN